MSNIYRIIIIYRSDKKYRSTNIPFLRFTEEHNKKVMRKVSLSKSLYKMGLEDNEGRKKEKRTRKKTRFKRVNN